MDKIKELEASEGGSVLGEHLTADSALIEVEADDPQDELPELKRLTFRQVIVSRIREAFGHHEGHLSVKEILRRTPGVLWQGLKAVARWPRDWTEERLADLRGWVEVQKALVRHRKRRRERIRNLSKLRNQTILAMLEENPLAFDVERPNLKGRELVRWYWLLFLRRFYSWLEVFAISKQSPSKRARKQEKGKQEEKPDKQAEPRGIAALRKRWADYWANTTRKESHGLFVQRKDSRLRLSKDQWRKLESVYARARRLMREQQFEEAVVSFEACISLLGRNTGDSIYEGLGVCKLAIFEKEAPKKPVEWIKQEAHDVAFCFQQAHWVNPANKMYLKRATDAQRLGEAWEDNHREMAAEIDRIGYELSQMEKQFPHHAGIPAARRELFNAKVSLSVWGYADAEKIVNHCRELLNSLG